MTAAIAVLNTNTTSDSVQDITLSCAELWSIGQQEAIRRLSIQRTCLFTKVPRQHLVGDFSARAARIAATYARFYLETEQGCNPDYKGRFYWMGLAAFASKQVKCALDFIPDHPLVPLAIKGATYISKNSLGKGNFWLFQDIFVWHWFYAQYPEQFDECAPQRDAAASVALVKRNMQSLPWAQEALTSLNNLKITDEITEAFNYVKSCESETDRQEKRQLQYSSLLSMASHEQLNILQPFIYENWAFNRTLDMQAIIEGVPLVPKRVASFITGCDTKDEKHRVQMEKDKNLYDAGHRMNFIRDIAKQYHSLMDTHTEYMDETISQIATWNNVS